MPAAALGGQVRRPGPLRQARRRPAGHARRAAPPRASRRSTCSGRARPSAQRCIKQLRRLGQGQAHRGRGPRAQRDRLRALPRRRLRLGRRRPGPRPGLRVSQRSRSTPRPPRRCRPAGPTGRCWCSTTRRPCPPAGRLPARHPARLPRDPVRGVYNHGWVIGDDKADLRRPPRRGSTPCSRSRPSSRTRPTRERGRAPRPPPPGRQVTVEDVRQLMGASTPHFALQIRNRIAKLDRRPAGRPPGPRRGRARDRAPRAPRLQRRGARHAAPRTASARCPRCAPEPDGHLLASRPGRGRRAARRRARVRGVPEDRRPLGAPAHVPDLRQDRLLRLVAQPARQPPRARGVHPILRSIEPGEDWSWCAVDEIMFVLRAG